MRGGHLGTLASACAGCRGRRGGEHGRADERSDGRRRRTRCWPCDRPCDPLGHDTTERDYGVLRCRAGAALSSWQPTWSTGCASDVSSTSTTTIRVRRSAGRSRRRPPHGGGRPPRRVAEAAVRRGQEIVAGRPPGDGRGRQRRCAARGVHRAQSAGFRSRRSACPPRRSWATTSSGAFTGTLLPPTQIGVFNRSHYEDVLVVRVKKLASTATCGASATRTSGSSSRCSSTRAPRSSSCT